MSKIDTSTERCAEMVCGLRNPVLPPVGYDVTRKFEAMAANVIEALAAERDALKKRIEGFWQLVSTLWDIEPREYFEAEAPRMGWMPEQMAAHHTWKRDENVAPLIAERDALRDVNARLLDALRDLHDEQNGPPIVRRVALWQAAMGKADALLAEGEEG